MGALPKKKEVVAKLTEDVNKLQVAVVFDYRGLSVAEITTLRRELYKNDAKLTVAKNTLLKRAIAGTALEAINPYLKGPTALLIGNGDQVAPVKVIKEYLKKNKKTNELRGGYLDGKALSSAEVDQLASLPSFDELRAKLLGGIASPGNSLVAAISGPQRALVNVLDQYSKQKAQQ